MCFEEKLTALCERLTNELQLQPNKIVFSKSINKQGEVASLFVQIYECEYPLNKSDSGTATPVLRITGHKTKEMFSTSKTMGEYLKNFCSEIGVEVKEVLDKNNSFQSVRFTFNDIDESYFEFIEKCVVFAISNYSSSANKFGCCSKYVECSNAKKCLHDNLLYATSCEYRKNLERGVIFYGENK